MALRTFTFAIFIALASLLSGCSGHPGTGDWVANKANASGFWVLVVEFDGKAKILSKTEGTQAMGCYWQASSAEIMLLQCATKENPETAIDYTLTVSADDIATLSAGDEALAEFRRRM